jgi:LysM repeat protein
MEEEKHLENRVCPYLGQRSDPGTAMSYPTGLNCCFHAKPIATIELGHQEEFCLTTGYPNCEEYAMKPETRLPAGLHGSTRRRSRKKSGNKWWVWGIALVIVGIILAWLLIARGGGFGQFLGAPTRSTESTETSTEIHSPVLSPTATSVPTSSPTFASTATFRPLLGLETPLGIDHKFLIHQIQAGDSLDRIAAQHGTTVAALLACNLRLPSPLVPGWAIVVPINFVDTQGFPAFEVYGVTEDISLEDLAIRLSVDLGQLKYYNALDDHFVPRAGDWLLVPRAGSPTPTP